jgi:hypothetical protein
MKIISQSHEETAYRLNALGAAISFVDWHKNSVTIDPAFITTPTKFPVPDALSRIERKIQNVKNLKLDLFVGESFE